MIFRSIVQLEAEARGSHCYNALETVASKVFCMCFGILYVLSRRHIMKAHSDTWLAQGERAENNRTRGVCTTAASLSTA